jgi:hypothetical protein
LSNFQATFGATFDFEKVPTFAIIIDFFDFRLYRLLTENEKFSTLATFPTLPTLATLGTFQAVSGNKKNKQNKGPILGAFRLFVIVFTNTIFFPGFGHNCHRAEEHSHGRKCNDNIH